MIDEPSRNWLSFLERSHRAIVSVSPLRFNDMTPSRVPELPGVYIITAVINESEMPYYIGRSKNLRQRLYNNHLMGPQSNARLKKYLVEFQECSDMESAKFFMKSTCLARWITESDARKRGAIEGYLTALLFPKYGIYEEH